MEQDINRPLPLEDLPCYAEKRKALRINYKTCLYRWRAEQGLTRKEAAFALQISTEYLRKLGTPADETRASLAILERISLFYNKNLYELFLPPELLQLINDTRNQ